MHLEARPAGLLGSAWALFTLVLSSVACTGPVPDTPVGASSSPVVYGADDRRDYHEASAAMQRLTRESIVALFRASSVDTSNPSNVRLTGPTLGDAYNLCSTERFRDHPAGGHCSGTLIDDDLVLTAGHCFADADPGASCRDMRFVFNYFYAAPGTLATVDEMRDVYSCRRIVTRRLETTEDRQQHDYAVVQLDRPVHSSHAPAPVRASRSAVARGSTLTIIGFGSGIPAKIDQGGAVLNERSGTLDYFRGTTDSFGGNSGSGVFASDGELVGVLVRGQRDYADSGSCTVVNVLSADQDESGGEQINYGFRAIDALCAAGWPSARLCDVSDECGDGTCSGSETHETCASDCDAPFCGDGICDIDEDESSCATDCGFVEPTIPSSWACEPGYYDRLDGCDCECGAYDPDCAVLGQQVYGCGPGQYCDGSATCQGAVVDVPSGWTCPVEYYDTNDGCDCQCGAYDPDCSDAGATVFGCGEGESCGADARCTGGEPPRPDGGTTPPPSGGGGCSASTPSPAAPAAALAMLAVAGMLLRRRR